MKTTSEQTQKDAHYLRAALLHAVAAASAAEIYRAGHLSEHFDACLREAYDEMVRSMDLFNRLMDESTMPNCLRDYQQRRVPTTPTIQPTQ